MVKLAEDSPLTVSELTGAIKRQLEGTFPFVSLQGEISNFKQQSSGHLYFSLKDEKAQISAVMFYGAASKLKAIHKNGDEVVVKGELSVYAPRGNYQIVIRELKPAGVGALLQRLEELKREIHKRGWFSKEHKKPLPSLPKRIGIITSPTGAAVRDMLNVLGRRFSGLHVLLNPVRVQGAEAAAEIVQAIQQFNTLKLADVIILGRGGGSIEDLWPFNEEIVAKAIFESNIPIIGAVGHETDHTIAEYVADARAPTPSAAAELVVREKTALIQHLEQLKRSLIQTAQHLARTANHQLSRFSTTPFFASPYALLSPYLQQLDDTKEQTETYIRHTLERKKMHLKLLQKQVSTLNPAANVTLQKMELERLSGQLLTAWNHLSANRLEILKRVATTLRAIDPKNLLRKGYSILFAQKDASVIKSVNDLQKHQRIRILVSDGEAIGEITDVESNI